MIADRKSYPQREQWLNLDALKCSVVYNIYIISYVDTNRSCLGMSDFFTIYKSYVFLLAIWEKENLSEKHALFRFFRALWQSTRLDHGAHSRINIFCSLLCFWLISRWFVIRKIQEQQKVEFVLYYAWDCSYNNTVLSSPSPMRMLGRCSIWNFTLFTAHVLCVIM